MITDLETFMIDEGFERIFRMLELRRVGDWTPREIEEKYIDQDQYVNNQYSFIKIVEVIELPDKDILIGYNNIDSWDDWISDKFKEFPIHYKKLSQIELSFYPEDMKEENWD